MRHKGFIGHCPHQGERGTEFPPIPDPHNGECRSDAANLQRTTTEMHHEAPKTFGSIERSGDKARICQPVWALFLGGAAHALKLGGPCQPLPIALHTKQKR